MRGRTVSVVVSGQRRIGDPRHRLRILGPTLAEYQRMDSESRHALLSALAPSAISRIGHRHRIPSMHSATDDTAVSIVDDLLVDPKTGLTEGLLNDLFAPIIEPTWHLFTELLGDDSRRPPAERIIEVGNLVADQFSVSHVKLFLSAVVEIGLPSRPEVRTLDPAQVPFAPHLPAAVSSVPVAPQAPAVPDERRQERQLRRAARRSERTAARAQRAARTGRRPRPRRDRDTTNLPISEDASTCVDSHDLLINLPQPERLQHPHLPDAAPQRHGPPIAQRGLAHIRWGQAWENGKVRPVLVIGASSTHLWVRPIYSRDLVAGRWRSVRINDWQEFGLDHESFVAVQVVRIPRDQCTLLSNVMTARDWNRVCRGEVHD